MKSVIFGMMVILTITSGLQIPVMTSYPESKFIPSATGISLNIDFGNGTVHEFQNLEGTNVYEVTDNVTTVEAEWFGDLAYIFSISKVDENDNSDLYWQYWVNGELGATAANKYILQDGDFVQWKLSSQALNSNTSNNSEPDYSLIIGGGVLGSVMSLVLIALWLNNREVKI